MERPRLQIGLPEHGPGEPRLHFGHVDQLHRHPPQLLQIGRGLDFAAHDLKLQLGLQGQPVERFSHGHRAVWASLTMILNA